MNSRLLKIIAVLSVGGLGLSIYSLLHNASIVSGSWCDLSATFSCDLVNKGPYSEIFGIPVALLGVIGYAFLLMSALLRLRQPADHGLKVFSLLVAGGGLAFSLYLSGLEAFVLHAWCVVCLTSQAIIFTVFVLTILSLRYGQGKNN